VHTPAWIMRKVVISYGPAVGLRLGGDNDQIQDRATVRRCSCGTVTAEWRQKRGKRLLLRGPGGIEDLEVASVEFVIGEMRIPLRHRDVAMPGQLLGKLEIPP